MSILTIGRIGLDLDLDVNAMRFTAGRDRVLRIEGEIVADSAAEALTLRNELYQMADADSPVYPVTFSEDSTVDGYYELIASDVKVGMASLSGYYPFRATLRRLGSEGAIALESRLTVGLRANDHSITPGEPFWAMPDLTAAYADWFGFVTGSVVSRTGDGVTMKMATSVPTTQKSVLFGIEAADFYDGAATIEVGSTLRAIAGLDSENDPANWRLNNGLVRVTPNGVNARIDVAHYDGSSWETEKTYQLSTPGGTEITTWDFLSIIRNDPVAVTIRLVERGSDFQLKPPVYLDLTLRRGSRYVECRLSINDESTATTFKIIRGATEAATSITGGIRATSNDGDGNRYVLGSTKTVTEFLGGGGVQNFVAATSFDFFIGSEIGGTGATSGDTAADLVKQYHGYLTETIKAVRR